MTAAEARSPERLAPLALALCLGLVWIVWGTTYLAIRVAVRNLPPLPMAGARFLIAGGLLAGCLGIAREGQPQSSRIGEHPLPGGERRTSRSREPRRPREAAPPARRSR